MITGLGWALLPIALIWGMIILAWYTNRRDEQRLKNIYRSLVIAYQSEYLTASDRAWLRTTLQQAGIWEHLLAQHPHLSFDHLYWIKMETIRK